MKSAVLASMIGFASAAHWAAAASPSPRCPIIDCKGCCAKNNEEPLPGCQWWNTTCETPVAHCASIKAEKACSADIACRWSTGPATPVNGTSFIAFDAYRGDGCDGGAAWLQCYQSESLDALEKWMAMLEKNMPCYDNVTCHCKPEIAWSPLQATEKHMVHAGTCSDCAGLQHYPRPWGGQTSDSPMTPWKGQGSGVLEYDYNSMVTETVVV